MPPMIYMLKTMDKQEYPVDMDPDTADALADRVAQKYAIEKSRITLIHLGKILKGNTKLSEFGIADEPQKNFGVLLLKKAATPKPTSAPVPEPAPVPRLAAEATEGGMLELICSQFESSASSEERLRLLQAAWDKAASPGNASCQQVTALTLHQIPRATAEDAELVCHTACQVARWMRGSVRPASPELLLQCAEAVGQDELQGAVLIRVARLLFCGEDGRLSAGWTMYESLRADMSPLKVLLQAMCNSKHVAWHAELGRILHDAPAAWPAPTQSGSQSAVDGTSATAAAAALQMLPSVPESETWTKHCSRLVQVVVRSWEGMGQSVQDIACPVILRWVFDCITTSPTRPSSALCSLLATIPQEYVEVVTVYIADEGSMLSDSSLNLCLGRMMAWPLDLEAKASWVAAVLHGVVSKGRLVLLTQAATTESAALFARLEQQALAPHTIGLIETLLGGCQFTPAAFHACLPHVPSVLASLQAQQPAASGASLLLRVVFLLQCMMFAHPGHPELYQAPVEIVTAVTAKLELQQPTDDKFRSWLTAREWKAKKRDRGAITHGVGKKAREGLTGLINLGNTCYMNSFMQALAATEAFRRALLSEAPAASASRFYVTIQSTIAHMKLTRQAVHRPSDLLHALPDQFAGGGQHDAFEFGKAAIDSVETAVKKATDPFTGELQVTITCKGCGQSSSRLESMQDLLLPLPDSKSSTTVEALLEQHFATELLQGESQYRCDKCGGLRDGQRVVRVMNAPDYLIIGLNRFCWDLKSKTRRKVLTEVTVPAEMQLACRRRVKRAKSGETEAGTEAEDGMEIEAGTEAEASMEIEAGTEAEDSMEIEAGTEAEDGMEIEAGTEEHAVKYELYAIVVHSGASAQAGHYYCYARAGEDLHWYLFNDQSISQSSLEGMQLSLRSFTRDTPYVLFYRRAKVDDLEGRESVHPLIRDQVTTRDTNAAQVAQSSTAGTFNKYRPDDNDDHPGGMDSSGPRFIF